MKIIFEGDIAMDVIDQIHAFLEASETPREAQVRETLVKATAKMLAETQSQGPGPGVVKPVEKPVEIPVGKPPKPGRTEKQRENDEKLRIAARAKATEKKAAREAAASTASMMPMPPPPATAESLGLAPDEVAKIRIKTIEDLQSAYANGFQKEVFELLSRFGNGAKSFRELPPESFVPIREAIDNGALT